MNLLEIKSAKPTLKVNYIKLPVTRVDNIEEFNQISTYWKQQELLGRIHFGIKRTPSGGISIKKLRLPAYDLVADKNNGCELIVLGLNEDDSPAFYRVQYRAYNKEFDKDGNEIKMYGRHAINEFEKELKKDNINLEDYYIDNGIEVKKTIETYMIALERESFVNRTFTNAHHLDIHNSFPSGMAEFIPEWRPAIERLYYSRKEHPENKNILNLTCGYFQSTKCFKARLAHVSKYAIARNNQKVREMARWLKATGRMVIAYNTDGIWFTGDSTSFNSKILGEWEEDHTNCTIRFKSKGAYEYIENNTYTPVIRGSTLLDKVKPRDQWSWGDIYQEQANIIKYVLDRELGVIKEVKSYE